MPARGYLVLLSVTDNQSINMEGQCLGVDDQSVRRDIVLLAFCYDHHMVIECGRGTTLSERFGVLM